MFNKYYPECEEESYSYNINPCLLNNRILIQNSTLNGVELPNANSILLDNVSSKYTLIRNTAKLYINNCTLEYFENARRNINSEFMYINKAAIHTANICGINYQDGTIEQTRINELSLCFANFNDLRISDTTIERFEAVNLIARSFSFRNTTIKKLILDKGEKMLSPVINALIEKSVSIDYSSNNSVTE